MTDNEYKELAAFFVSRGFSDQADAEEGLRSLYQAVCFDDWSMADRRTYDGCLYVVLGQAVVDRAEGYSLTDEVLIIRGEDGRLLELDPSKPTLDPSWQQEAAA